MQRFRDALAGLVSFVVFIAVFAVTALPAIIIVEDDNAFVTYGVLGGCAFVGWIAARYTHRWIMRGQHRM